MPVDHDSPTPLYIQLADILRGQIQRGELTGRIPSVKTLGQEYEVSHVTVEKALDLLKREGLLQGVIGRGTFVK